MKNLSKACQMEYRLYQLECAMHDFVAELTKLKEEPIDTNQPLIKVIQDTLALIKDEYIKLRAEVAA